MEYAVVIIVALFIGWIVGRYTMANEHLKSSLQRITDNAAVMRDCRDEGYSEGFKEGVGVGVEMCLTKVKETDTTSTLIPYFEELTNKI